MANLSKDLKSIFNKYLERKEREKYQPRKESYFQPTLFSGGESQFTGIIYFYEWSDITRQPKVFYTLEKFEDFLEQCNIYLLGWQREVIRNMHNPYISCKKGEKELLIKVSYEQLKAALLDNNISSSNKGSEDKEPYQVAITRPRMVFESGSRYPDMMPHQEIDEYWDW
jgi:hypothetical protein